MRVYCYSPETGVYQGIDYVDERHIDRMEGVTPLAPPLYAVGELPVFDRKKQCWRLVRYTGDTSGPIVGQT